MLTNRCNDAGFGRGPNWRSDSSREGRQALREQPGLRFVERDEFCELLLSCKKLIRSDEPSARLRGLLDVESGERYLIEQEELFVGSY